MKLLNQKLYAIATALACILGAWVAPPANAGVAISMAYPLSATPGDTLSVTSTVVNTGSTLAGLQVSEILPGGTSYQYVSNSLQINVVGGAAITNATGLLTINGGTNLVINLSNIQATNGPASLVLSEVFPGASASQSWFEIFNPTANAISTAGWTVKDDRPGVAESLPAYTVQPGQFVVVVPNSNNFVAAYPGYTNALIVVTNNFYSAGVAYGLNQFADGLSLINASSTVVDALSWGFDTSIFNPSVPYPSTTQSLERYPANVDTSTANDWIVQSTPDPSTGTVISGLASGGAVNIIYQLTAQCGGVGGYFNSTASYQQPPGSATQSTNTVNFIAFANPVLLVSKTPQEQQATEGGLVTWQLSVYNSGFGVARNTVLYDSIASGLTFVGFSIPPTTPNPTATNAVYWNTAAIPALAGLTNGSAPISITVTALVNSCGINLNNRGDASFGLNSADFCQDTRGASSGAEAAIEFAVVVPTVTFYVTPTNPAVPYCSGTNITISVTNSGAVDTTQVGVIPTLLPGYFLTLTNGSNLPTNSAGALILSSYLAKGTGTNIVLHLQPGGICPLVVGTEAQFLDPVFDDPCGNSFEDKILPLLTTLTGMSAAAVTETYSPASLGAFAGTNVTVTANLVYTNMGSVAIAQHLVQSYPTNAGWGFPTNITGGGVLNTNAGTITWTTNVTGSGNAVFGFNISITNACTYASGNFRLQPATFLDCQGCTQYVDTNALPGYFYLYGCGSGGCGLVASVSSPIALVEDCASQPFTMVITNFSGTFSSRWTNISWTAGLSGGFTYNSGAVQVFINGTNVTSSLAVTNFGSTLQVLLTNLNNIAEFTNLSSITNLTISWNAAVSQIGSVAQTVGFNLCALDEFYQQWAVGNSALVVSLTPALTGFECGYVSVPIALQQLSSPYVDFNTNTGIFPDYNVDVVLNMDPINDPGALGVGTPIPTLSFVTNSTILSGIISNAVGRPLILTNVPVVTNNLVIWHLGNLGVFTNGTITAKFQTRCGGAPISDIQASVRYNNNCGQGTTPQTYGSYSGYQLVSDQTSSLQGFLTPAQITMITTNFTFQVEYENTKAAAAHNFFIEVQVPTNVMITSATVPWNYTNAVNSGTNAYYWTFTNNAAPLQGLIDDLGDGSFNDLAPNSSFILSVTGAVSSCVNQVINAYGGSGCLGSICQQVGPLPVQLQPVVGQAVAMLVFPTTLPVCLTNSLYYDVRNAGISSIYQVTPSFYLPAGLSYIAGSATATNAVHLAGATSMSIPDPASGNGTSASPFVWTPSQVSYLGGVTAGSDVIIGFKVKVACDSSVSGEGGASATYFDTCGGFNQTALELSAGEIGVPSLSLTKTFLDLNDHPKNESVAGETNIFYLTIQPTAQSAATVQGMQLTDFFPTNSFSFLGASIKPDGTNGGNLVWSNATLMAAIPNQVGGPYYVTSAPISLVITGLTLANCTSPAVNSAEVDYGCADSLCQSTLASVGVSLSPILQFSSASESLQLTSCGGTYSVTMVNNGAPATGIIWTNYAPTGYLITGATVSGALNSPTNQSATITLGGSTPYVGSYAVLNLSATNVTNVRGTTNYNGDYTGIYLGPGQSFTVTYSLVPDGSTLDCTVNTYPPAPTPVTVTNSVSFNNFCGTPSTVGATFTALPDQPKPAVDIEPKEVIVTNGQIQNFTITIENIGTHGNASELEARVLFQQGWTNITITGVTNNATGSSTNIIVGTNAQNGVLANLGGVILAPLQTVVIGVSATAIANGNPLNITAETVGTCGSPSPNACTSFSPSNPLAMTMPPSTNVMQLTNTTIYGFYQDYADATGFSLSKTVRYATEAAAAGGSNRVALIGENLTYRITATFFDAPFTNIVVNDSLPPNLVFGTPVDAGSSANVVGWTFNATTGNFTLPTPVSGIASFVVDLPVIVTNGLLNQAGVSFTNTASTTFTTVVTNVPPSVSTVVSEVEPTLYVTTLVATNTSSFAGSLANLQAGNLVYYQIVITNTLGTNAYNLWLSNSLPPGFTSPNVVSVTSTGVIVTNGVTAGPLNASLLNFTNGTTLNVGTNEFDVYTNSSLTIVISAVPAYTVQPGQVTTDSSTIQWSSLPGFAPQERTGVGLTPPPGVNDSLNNSILNNYADTSAAVITTDAGILFSKVLVGTDHAAPGNGLTNVVIGENVFYTLSVTVPQGTTPSLVITDTLPFNLAYVGVTNFAYTANVTNSQPLSALTNQANVVVSGNGQTVVFNLGNVTNLNNNDQFTNGLSVTFQAVVLDVLTNRAGTNFINSASFTWGAASPTNVSSAAVGVVEPQLQVSELVAPQVAGAPGVFSSSAGGLQANDTIYYQIVITNGAGVFNTTAYNLYESNSLPAGLVNATIYSVSANTNLGNVYSNGVPQIGALSTSLFGINPANNVLTNIPGVSLALETNAAIVVVVAVTVNATNYPGTVFTDTNTIEWASLPGTQTNLSAYNPAGNSRMGVSTPLPVPGVNNYGNNTLLNNYAAAASTVTATAVLPGFVKTLQSTDHTAAGLTATNVVIGEHVNYTLTMTVPQGVTTGVQFTDTLPQGLGYVGVTNVAYSSGVSNLNLITLGSNQTFVTLAGGSGINKTATFNLGNVTNASSGDAAATLAITFQTVVLDTNFSRAGVAFTNLAQMTSVQFTSLVSTSAVVSVIEPVLQVNELVGTNLAGVFAPSVTTVQANDTIYYQITITNVGANYTNTTAYNLYESNSLPAGLVNPVVYSVTAFTNSGNVYSNGVGQIGPLSTSLFGINPVNNVLTNVPGVNLALEPNAGIVLLVAATVNPTNYIGTIFTDTNTIEWASLPGIQTNLSAYASFGNERLGVSTPLPGAGVSNYFNSALLDNYAVASVAVTASSINPGFTKVLVGTDHTAPGNTNNQVTIGERPSYILTMIVPQGVTPNATITDTLPKGLAYVGVTNVTWSVGVSNLTPIPVGTNSAPAVPQVTFTANKGNQVVVFSLGNVTNMNSGDASNVLSIIFQAVVLDTNSVKAGNSLVNSAKLVSGSFNTTMTDSGVTVVEPKLTISELIATNFLGAPGVYGASVSDVQANDTIYYEIIITNAAGANITTAYNLYVSNSLPVGLVNPSIYSVTAYTNSGNVFSNGVGQVGGALSTSLFGINPANNVLTNAPSVELDLETNASIILVVSAQLSPAINPATVLIDTNTIEWQSLPGPQTNQTAYLPSGTLRSGVGTPLPGPGVNNYASGVILDYYSAASLAVAATVINPQFSKVLLNTSVTNPGNQLTNVVIGELANYTLTVTVPQGVTPNATISDALPTNMAFVDVSGLAWSLNVSNSQPVTLGTTPANTTIGNTNGGVGNWVVFSLGNVTNANTTDASNILSITFQAVTLDVFTNRGGVGMSNYVAFAEGTFATNNSLALGVAELKTSVQVVEPTLQVSELVGTNTTLFTAGVASVQASNTVYFQIVITNSGGFLSTNGTTAYNLWVSNSLPAGLVNPQVVSITNAGIGIIYTNTVAGTAGLNTNLFSFGGGTTLTVAPGTEIDLNTNGSIIVVVSAQLGAGVNPLQALTNNTDIEWASLPGTQMAISAYNPASTLRNGGSVSFANVNYATNFSTNTTLLDNYAAVSGAAVSTVVPLAFSKALISTSVTNPGNGTTNAVIGELANYTLTLTVPQGLTTNAQVVDVLPTNMAFVAVSGATWSTGVSNSQPVTLGTTPANTAISNTNAGTGNWVTFNLGNVTNANLNNSFTQGLTLTFQAVVLDAYTNRGGVGLSNLVTFVSGGYLTNNFGAAALLTSVQVVEPTLQVSELAGTNASVFTPVVASVQAGDTVYYQIVITNSGGFLSTNGTTAYNLWVSNSLPAGLVNPTVFSVTAGGTGHVYTNNTTLVSGSLGTAMFGINNNVLTNVPTANFALDTNGSLVVVVSAQLAATVSPLQILGDNTDIQWASLPGTQVAISSYNPASTLRDGASVSFANVNYATNFSTNTTLLDNYAAISPAAVSTVIAPLFSKALISTSITNPGNQTTNAVIGELASYTLTLTIPQGVTTNATITDVLPTNMAFVDVSGVTWSANVSNSQPVTLGTTPGNTAIGNTNAGAGNWVTFNLGNVTNANNNDIYGSGLTITFQAVALDTYTNRGGVGLSNLVTFVSGGYFTNNTGAATLLTSVQVVEPTLQVSELVGTNTTLFTAGVASVQASNTVYFQIVITNSGGFLSTNGTTAYNLWVSNSLPAGLVNPQVVSITNAGIGIIYTNTVAGTAGLNTNLFSFGGGTTLTVAPGTEIDLNTNGSIIVVVSAQLGAGVNPLQALTNNTDIEWASLPGTQMAISAYNPASTLRNGGSVSFANVNYATNFSTNTTLLNNYAAVSGAAVSTVLSPSFSKALVGTSVTNPGNGTTNVVIGELATYVLTLTVPQGVATNVTIVDTLPTNLAFVNVTNVAWSAGVSNSQPVTIATNPANTTIANNGNQITFNLGSVTNANINNGTASLAITFTAVALDVLTNQAGTNFINSVQANMGTVVITNYSTGGLGVVEPTLQVGELVSASPTSGFGSSVSTLQAGDMVYYQLIITNSAGVNGTTAYNLWLSNSLPSGLVNPSVYFVTNSGLGNVYSNQVAVTGSLSNSLFNLAGNLLTVAPGDFIDLNTNGAIVVVVAAQVGYTNALATTFPDLTAIEWASLPGTQTNLSSYISSSTLRNGASVSFAGVNYATNFSTNSALLDNYAAVAAATASTAPSNPTFAKVLVGTDHTAPGNGATNAVIGEHVTYQLTLTVPQGLTTNAVIVDTLPTNLAFVGVTGVSWSANVTNSQPVTIATNPANTTVANNGTFLTFHLGNITNLNASDAATNGLTITFQTVVLDLLTNQAGTNFINTATFTSGAYSLSSNAGPVLVVEPTLQVSEQISGDGVNYGSFLVTSNLVYYQLVITNSAGPNGTTAYNLWLSNSLPAGLINPYVYSVTNLGAGNVYTNGLSGTNGLSPTLFSFNGNLLTVASANEIDLDTNGAIVLVVAAQVANVANSALPLTNNTTIEWSSLPGVQTNLSAYNPAGNARTGVSTPLPAPGVNNSTNNALLDNYAAAASVVLDYIPAAIGNYVWNDNNADGVRQGVEKGIPGVQVFIDLNGTGQYATNDPSAITDTNGYYLITNLVGSTYTVAVNTNTLNIAAPGAHETYSLVGGTNAPQEAVSLVLTNGTTRLDANFGYDYSSPTLAGLSGGSFQGVATNGGVLLTWTTLSEVDTAYYVVNRASAGGQYDDTIGYELAIDSLVGNFYEMKDTTAIAAGTYPYQLEEVQTDGSTVPLAVCTVVISSQTVGGTPLIITIGVNAGNIVLQWTGGTAPYSVEETTDLSQSVTNWTAVPLANTATNTVVLPMTQPAAYFRVLGSQ